MFFTKGSLRLLKNYNFTKSLIRLIPRKSFNTTVPVKEAERVYGGLKDQDRIFSNIYCDTDPFIEGAIKRVSV